MATTATDAHRERHPLALVTGASSGIGREAAASCLMPDRAKAAMHGRTTEPGSAHDDS